MREKVLIPVRGAGKYDYAPFEMNTSTVDWCSWVICYNRGYKEPHFPVPSLIGEVRIEDYRVTICTPRQSERTRHEHWLECNEDGWIFCLAQWWDDPDFISFNPNDHPSWCRCEICRKWS